MLRRLRQARQRLARRKTRVRRGQDVGALRAGRGHIGGKTRVDAVPSYFLAVLYTNTKASSLLNKLNLTVIKI